MAIVFQNGYSITPNTEFLSWEIVMHYEGKKLTAAQWTSATSASLRTSMGSPGTSTFMTMTETSTGANTKTNFGDGVGLYGAFFNKTNIAKVAFVDGSSTSLDPTQHTNYLIYELVETTATESFNNILKRLDIYQRDAPAFQNNDIVWPSPSVLNHTAGTTGYSGLLIASGGGDFKTTNIGMPSGIPQIPDKFAVMGINRDSDNDVQALCAFWGNLQTGKGDSWRNQNPSQTFWSYWGQDFHSNSTTQRIGSTLQSAPGVATGATWTGSVYMLAF
jgi:hypothetical protein